MSWVENTINWYLGLRNSEKFRTPRKTPPYVSAEVGSLDQFGVPQSWYSDWEFEKQQRAAIRLSWIYSNIIRIGNEVAAADFSVFKEGTHEKDINHPFEQIMKFPNPFFDGRTLLKYAIWALSVDEYGAFWFVAPDRQSGMPREIWPIMIGRLEPVKDENQFIKKYIYTANNGEKLPIRREFICRFIYPDPDDMWRSLPPLKAALLPISVYQGITTAQRDIFTESRGTPLSVLSLDANISDPDFARARQRIREDWEESRKIAVVRAGSLDVRTVGLSNRDLEVIASAEFTRDELDSVFMGFAWRQSTNASEREAINKEIKETVIHPLHKQLAAQIQLSIITPFYGAEFIGEFDDIRAQDRSIQLQENQLYWRVTTIDEARAARGQTPFKWTGETPQTEEDDEDAIAPFSDYGSLPYVLATNPAFISTYYGFGAVKDPEKKPDDIGNISEQLDPDRVVDELAGADDPPDVDLKAAAVAGVTAELKRYKTVMLRTWRDNNDTQGLIDREFETTIIPTKAMDDIKMALPMVTSEQDITDIFGRWLQ